MRRHLASSDLLPPYNVEGVYCNRYFFSCAVCLTLSDDQEKQDAIRRMTELMATQENIVPAMRENDLQVRAIMVRLSLRRYK